MKINCWQFTQCGREPGGAKVHELGICPVVKNLSSHGVNGGTCAGRYCWTVAGTFCGGQVQGSYAKKRLTCLTCKFYLKVHEEEGINFINQES